MSVDLSHITLDEAGGKADCSVCKMGVTVPPSFGGVPRSDMLAAFVVQHAVHTKASNPSGLTATGRAPKAARAYMSGSA
jgi:hypothetical protein